METILAIRTGLPDTWNEKLAGMQAFASTSGWQIQVVDGRSAIPDIARLVRYWQAAGLILDASGDMATAIQPHIGRIPHVYINPADDRIRRAKNSVVCDSPHIVDLAARELLSRPLAALAFVSWFTPVSWATDKESAFFETARMHNIPTVSIRMNATLASDRIAAEKELAQRLKELPRPAGVFAVNDAIGVLVISAANQSELVIPDELSVVSVDDDSASCESCVPTLSSVRPDFFRVGFAAGRQLMRQIRFPNFPAHTMVVPPSGLTRRASSRLVGRSDMTVLQALDFIRRKACDGISPRDVIGFFRDCTVRSAELRFKAATGRSISKAIAEVRLERAVNYLQDSDLPITTIADCCGWNSDIAFRKAFVAKFGVPPRHYAKTHFRHAAKKPKRRPPPSGKPAAQGAEAQG